MKISEEWNIVDELQRKPIHYAAACENTLTLEFLLKNGIDAREGDKEKTTPLMIASKTGRDHNVKLLLQNNRSVVSMKNKEGNNALHFAALGGHV